MSAERPTSSHTHEWLWRMAEAEDRYPSIGVGGLAVDAGLMKAESAVRVSSQSASVENEAGATRVAFVRFIELARRSRRLTLETLAADAGIDLAELVEVIEEHAPPTPRTVYHLARVLRVPSERLMELSGLVEAHAGMVEAAIRFAARSEPSVDLSPEERHAFDEFVKVLVEKTDGG